MLSDELAAEREKVKELEVSLDIQSDYASNLNFALAAAQATIAEMRDALRLANNSCWKFHG